MKPHSCLIVILITSIHITFSQNYKSSDVLHVCIDPTKNELSEGRRKMNEFNLNWNKGQKINLYATFYDQYGQPLTMLNNKKGMKFVVSRSSLNKGDFVIRCWKPCMTRYYNIRENSKKMTVDVLDFSGAKINVGNWDRSEFEVLIKPIQEFEMKSDCGTFSTTSPGTYNTHNQGSQISRTSGTSSLSGLLADIKDEIDAAQQFLAQKNSTTLSLEKFEELNQIQLEKLNTKYSSLAYKINMQFPNNYTLEQEFEKLTKLYNQVKGIEDNLSGNGIPTNIDPSSNTTNVPQSSSQNIRFQEEERIKDLINKTLISTL